MNFYNIVQNILNTSSRHKNVKEVSEGDIYNYLNSGEHKYPCIFLTVGEVTDSEMSRNVNCTLFYVDRLVSDQSNRTAVQSLGITTLGDILDTIEGDVVSVNYTTFTEKFTDLCAGVFATADITYPMDEICDEHFDVRRLEVTENGVYETIGYDEFVVNVSDIIYVKDLDGMRFAYSKTSSIPDKYVFSGVTDFNNMFYYCTNLKYIPLIDTSNGTDFGNMFYNCHYITYIPQLDTSNGTNFSRMFYECSWLKSIPQIDTSKGTDFKYMFYDCYNLTTIPQLNTSSGTDFSCMFQSCDMLSTISQLDISNGTTFSNMFYYCTALKDITFTGSINASIDFSSCRNITYDSVKSILTACSNTTKTTTSKTLKFSRSLTDQNGELAALVADCNSKKWTISGLTLK